MSKIETTTKRKYITIGKDGVAARRQRVFDATQEFLAEQGGSPVKQADVYRAVLSKCGLEDKPTVWNDLCLALKSLAEQTKAERKRATYTARAPQGPQA